MKMNRISASLLVLLPLSAGLAIAQTHQGMPMTDAEMTKMCEQMMGKGHGGQGMDMKQMHARCQEHMKRDGKAPAKATAGKTHDAVAVVKQVDVAGGKVVLDHGPVDSLGWPAMTMGFVVKDKKLLGKLVVGQKVNVKFVQQGSQYVVTAVS